MAPEEASAVREHVARLDDSWPQRRWRYVPSVAADDPEVRDALGASADDPNALALARFKVDVRRELAAIRSAS